MRNPGLLIVAGGGLLGYYLYSKGYFHGLLGTTTTTTPPPTNTGGGGGTTVTPPPPAPSTSQIAGIASRMLSAPGVTPTIQYSPDQWGYVFNVSNNLGLVAPDPMILWPSYDRSNPLMLSFQQYWQVMSPYLHTSAGLSGVGGYV